jgi:hypothetical protein
MLVMKCMRVYMCVCVRVCECGIATETVCE